MKMLLLATALMLGGCASGAGMAKRGGESPSAPASQASYTCSMCGGSYAQPGNCSKCGMALKAK